MERDKKFIIRKFFNEYLDLNRSKEDEQVTVDSIRNGVEFKGTNLWVLIFATFYCFTWVECEFYGGNYRCNVDISADGTDYGSRTCCRVE